MNIILKSVKSFLIKLFSKSKKITQLPQGEEYENWLGV